MGFALIVWASAAAPQFVTLDYCIVRDESSGSMATASAVESLSGIPVCDQDYLVAFFGRTSRAKSGYAKPGVCNVP